MAIAQECCKQYWTSPRASTPQNTSYAATYHPSRKLSKLDESDMWDTDGEVGTNSQTIYSCGLLHMDEQRQDDQLESIYNSSVPIQNIALKTDRERWTIETGGERGSGRSVLVVRHDELCVNKWFGFVSLFNGISTFVDYLMSKPFKCYLTHN